MERINKKFETARSFVPRPELAGSGKSKVGIIAYGTSHWAIVEARDQLAKEHKLETDYLRVRSYPFTREVHDFIEKHERTYVVEQNRDGQMASLLKLDIKRGIDAAAAVNLPYSRIADGCALGNRRTHDDGG